MQIIWNDIGLEEWDELLKSAPRSNLLHAWPYAQMMRTTNQMATRFGRLVEGDETIAIFQVQEVSFFSFYQAITLDRGPVWLIENVTTDHWKKFTILFHESFPKRFGHKRRFMPEMMLTPQSEQVLNDCGFEKRAEGYRSIWLDLRQSEEGLRKGFKQKWRNALNQAEKKGLQTEISDSSYTFNWLMRRYDEDRKKRSYQGPSLPTLKGLYKYCRPRGEVVMMTALKDNINVAGILLFKHGQSATYQVGWTSEKGRETRAHQLLLWQSIRLLKEEGIEVLDLGGINPDHAEGVTQFKRGLGGEEFQLAGVYA